MTPLSTPVTPPTPPFLLSYHSKLLMMGSCFTENIGNKLAGLRFKACINPFGIVFNPMSLASHCLFLLGEKHYRQEDIFCHAEIWSSFEHHSEFSAMNPETCLHKINNSLEYARKFLSNEPVFIITFGSAWIYTHKKTEKIVANCHKLPSETFEKRLLEPEEIISEWEQVLNAFDLSLPGCKWIFTVSPVRHWRDGAIQNQWNKATLLLSIRSLLKKYPEKTYYFPAYEIVMDELRDYRFFEKDMLHPNEVAVNYLWEKLQKTIFDTQSNEIIPEIARLREMEAHRLLFPQTQASALFLLQVQQKKDTLSQKYPFIDFYSNNYPDI